MSRDQRHTLVLRVYSGTKKEIRRASSVSKAVLYGTLIAISYSIRSQSEPR